MSEWSDLEKTLFDTSEMYYRRRDALVKMARLDKARVADALAAVAGDDEKVLRREAAKLLMDVQPQKARPVLVKLVSDEDSDVRRNALASLAKVGDPSCADAVRPLLDDKNYFVKREAEKALEAMGSREAPSPEASAPAPPAQAPAAADPGEALAAELKGRDEEPDEHADTEPMEPGKPADEKALDEFLQLDAVEVVEEAPPRELPPWKREEKPPPPKASAPKAHEELPPWKQGPKKPPKAVRSISAPGKASDSEERLPPWKRKGAAVLSSSVKPTVDDADLKAQILKLKKKRETHKERKRSRRRRKEQPRQATQRPAAKASAPKKDPYKIYIPVAKVDGTVRQPSRPTNVREAAARTEGGPSKLCPKCKWVLKPGQRYCNFCGAPITPAAGAGPSAPPPPRYTPKYGSQPVASFTRRPRPQGAGKGCTVAVVVAIVAAGIFSSIVFAFVSTASDMEEMEVAKAQAEAGLTKVKKAEADLERIEKKRARLAQERARERFRKAMADARKRKLGPRPLRRDAHVEASRARALGRPIMGAPAHMRVSAKARVTMITGEVFEGVILQDTKAFFEIQTEDGRKFLQRKSQVRKYQYFK